MPNVSRWTNARCEKFIWSRGQLRRIIESGEVPGEARSPIL